jgi:hypothetical protein
VESAGFQGVRLQLLPAQQPGPALINGLEASIQSLIGRVAEGGWGLHTLVGAGGVSATRKHRNYKGEATVSSMPAGTLFTLAATILRLPLQGVRFKKVRAACLQHATMPWLSLMQRLQHAPAEVRAELW